MISRKYVLVAGTAGTLLSVFGWMILYFWYILFVNLDSASPYSFNIRLLNCINPNIAMGSGISLMAQYEVQCKGRFLRLAFSQRYAYLIANGFHWSNLFTKATPDQEMTMGHIFVMLIIDALILAFITWFVEAVNPGGEGVPQKPWFMFLVCRCRVHIAAHSIIVCYSPRIGSRALVKSKRITAVY